MTLVIDEAGNRTGWTQKGPIDEIRGCVRGSGSEEGIPNPEGEPDDTSGAALPQPLPRDAAIDTVPDEREPTPKYYYFHISNDAVTPVGLIDQGGCQLRLDPIVAGKVQLGLSARKGALILCQDTTSVWVQPGVPLRWRLSWRTKGNRCVTKMERIEAKAVRDSRNR
jgi:hypothetical protein